MRIAVLGAGVVGASTAYALSVLGHDVTLIDAAAEPAAGSSHANGGQLSFSFTDSFARPSFVLGLPRLLLGRDPAVRVRFAGNLRLMPWGVRFLRQCTRSRANSNTVALMVSAIRSAELMGEIGARTGVDFAYDQTGKLVLLPERADIAAVRRTQQLKHRYGCKTELLSYDEACCLEPALSAFRGQFAAAIHSASDAVGDARRYTQGLVDWLVRERGLSLRLNETALSLLCSRKGVQGVRTDRDVISADATIVCLGAESAALLQPAGVKCRIYPVRGYSVTLPRGPKSPSISITDLQRRLLFCPLNGRLRIAGFADFLGSGDRLDARRTTELLAAAQRLAPHAADFAGENPQSWAGSRPMTPDGRPLVGGSGVPGLYLNCGHGMLGWTLAASCAESVAAAVQSAT